VIVAADASSGSAAYFFSGLVRSLIFVLSGNDRCLNLEVFNG